MQLDSLHIQVLDHEVQKLQQLIASTTILPSVKAATPPFHSFFDVAASVSSIHTLAMLNDTTNDGMLSFLDDVHQL